MVNGLKLFLFTIHHSPFYHLEDYDLLAIRLMRMGAKKQPTYRVVVKEKLSKRDGAYLENLGTYNPTREPAEVNLNMERVRYWLARGAQPADPGREVVKDQGEGSEETGG